MLDLIFSFSRFSFYPHVRNMFFQWFDEKATLLENIDMQLRRLHNNVEVLVMNRKELAVSTSQFAKAAAMLSNCEEHTGLSRALSQLADVEEKVNIIIRSRAQYVSF